MTTSQTDKFVPAEQFFEFMANPKMRAEPYGFYARLREHAPVSLLPIGLVAVSGYAEVSSVLKDQRFSADERNSYFYEGDFEETPFGKIATSMMLFLDDPDHKRLRDLVQKAFTRKVVEDLRPRITGIVDELVDGFVSAGGGDLLTEVAYPFPVFVICELLGVPKTDRPLFHDWAKELAARLEIQPLRTPEQEARAEIAVQKMGEYFDGLIEERRSQPRDDLLTSLALVEEGGYSLTHDELLATCMLLLVAGHETTANLIGNGVHALMRHRDQWDRLTGDPSLARPATEELLRFDSPVQFLQRTALEDLELGGTELTRGTPVAVLLGAANRDGAHFPDPDRLDLTRDAAPLVAFGGGIHFCLGAPLARLEAQSAFGALAQKAPSLEVAVEPNWRDSFVFRGLQRFELKVS